MTDEKRNDELTIAHQAANPGEALVIRELLEANGIKAVIPGENSPFPGIDLTPFSTRSGAGCDVLVLGVDLARAKALIAERPSE